MTGSYVPNELLSRLVGWQMYSVEFVLNDYVQLRFEADGPPGEGSLGPAVLNCYAWPIVRFRGQSWTESDLGYGDALRRLTPGVVTATAEATGTGLKIDLDTGSVVIHPAVEDVYVEIATLSVPHGGLMVWRPGEESFEDLI